MRLFQCAFFFVFTSTLLAQRQPDVDFINSEVHLTVYPYKEELKGMVFYDFVVNKTLDSIYLDAVNIQLNDCFLNGEKIELSNNGKRIGFAAPKENGNHKLDLNYIANPKQTVYFLGRNDTITGNEQVWTQGQGKYTSHWLPSLNDMSEKIKFHFLITTEKKNLVISNGKLVNVIGGDKWATWIYHMEKPMSSYLAAFVIGDFERKVIKSISGIPIELYYEPKDSLKIEPTYRYTKQIFDFLEEQIGFPYPWQNYKQVPVQDFLYAGMENTGTTIFSNQYMIDSTAFIDKNYVNVNAHELAHQWFGNLVTEESGDHHWLHEGFATYYAYLAEQYLFGDDHFYWKLYETAKTLYNLSENGDGEALTNPNANSLTFYEKGAWALVMLKDEVGEEAFKNGTKAYLEKHQFENVTIANFLTEIENASEQRLTGFRQKWLESEEFPWNEVIEYLRNNSKSIRTFLNLQRGIVDYPEPYDPLIKLWKSFESDNLKCAIIKEFNSSFLEPDFLDILKQESITVRKNFIVHNDSIPIELKDTFESFLDDKSYVTQEVLLYRLWSAFPDDRIDFLEKTKKNIGLPNKNVRLLWLTLALITSEYQSAEKLEYYNELNGYTASQYHFEVRQIAFRYLSQIQAFSDESLRNLIIATNHHVWQFKKSSRNLLKQLAQNNEMKTRLLNISYSMAEEEQFRLKKLIYP